MSLSVLCVEFNVYNHIMVWLGIFSRLYYAQALNKACLYEEAMKVSCQIEASQYAVRVSRLSML